MRRPESIASALYESAWLSAGPERAALGGCTAEGLTAGHDGCLVSFSSSFLSTPLPRENMQPWYVPHGHRGDGAVGGASRRRAHASGLEGNGKRLPLSLFSRKEQAWRSLFPPSMQKCCGRSLLYCSTGVHQGERRRGKSSRREEQRVACSVPLFSSLILSSARTHARAR